MDNISYENIVDFVIYVMICTLLDIAYVKSVFNKFISYLK